MIALVAILALSAPAYSCRVADAECWMTAALAQQERAERAEARVILLEEAVTIGKRLLADSDARGDRWQKLADKIAPKAPAFWEQPAFWVGVGFVAGAATTAAITYIVNQPR